MNRLFPLALFAVLASGCARSDLGERAASQVVQKAIEGEAKDAKKNLQKVGKIEVKGGKFSGADAKGNKLWELSAKLIDTKGQVANGNPQRATLTGAKAKLYRAGKLESTFDAPLIEFFNSKAGLRLAMPKGVKASNVGALGKDGVPIVIAAPRGDVDVTKRLVSLSNGARVERGAIVVTGKTLRTQTDLARAQMSGDVAALSPQGKTQAKDAIFAWKEDKLSANGVTFTKDDLVLTGNKLSADTAAEKGVLTGDVRAKTPNSTANAPSVNFDWNADSIRAPRAIIVKDGAQMQTGALQTDSHLKVGNAENITIEKDGATLKAASAQGFDGLKQLVGKSVTIVKDGLTLVAARANAKDWSAKSGKVEASGGVRASNKDGKLKAENAVWSGGENGNLVANGGVEIVAQGATIRGARATSDAKFNIATLSGDVRAVLDDGSTLNAPKVSKRGQQIVASGGATARKKTEGEMGVLTLQAPRIETTIQGATARARGGVQIQSASGATATAPLATYNRTTQKVVASGGVTYNDPRRGGLKGKGETLTADLRLQNARMTGFRGESSGDLFDGKSLFD